MDLAALFHRLWRLKWALPTACVGALLGGVLSAYHVSLLQLALHARVTPSASAQSEVVFDAPHSFITDLNVLIRPLDLRTRAFADYFASPRVRRLVARKAGLPAGAVVVAGRVDQTIPRSIAEAGGDERGVEVLDEPRVYRVTFNQPLGAPLLQITAQAPSESAAMRLANAAVAAAVTAVRSLQQFRAIPPSSRITTTRTGPPEIVARTSAPTAALLVGVPLVLFPSICALALFFEGFRRRFRAARRNVSLAGAPWT